MAMKNYRVYYKWNDLIYHLDFSSSARTDEDIRYSALYSIRKIHPGVTGDDITGIDYLYD